MNLDPAYIQALIIPWGIKIVTALAIFIIGRMLAKWLTRMIRKVMNIYTYFLYTMINQ